MFRGQVLYDTSMTLLKQLLLLSLKSRKSFAKVVVRKVTTKHGIVVY